MFGNEGGITIFLDDSLANSSGPLLVDPIISFFSLGDFLFVQGQGEQFLGDSPLENGLKEGNPLIESFLGL